MGYSSQLSERQRYKPWEDYSEYLARTGGTTNFVVVEYWTEDGDSATDEKANYSTLRRQVKTTSLSAARSPSRKSHNQ